MHTVFRCRAKSLRRSRSLLAVDRRQKKRVKELVIIAGRHCGKDSIASVLATFTAAVERNYAGRLPPGELAHIYCIAADRDQAAIVHGMIRAFFADIPDLA